MEAIINLFMFLIHMLGRFFIELRRDPEKMLSLDVEDDLDFDSALQEVSYTPTQLKLLDSGATKEFVELLPDMEQNALLFPYALGVRKDRKVKELGLEFVDSLDKELYEDYRVRIGYWHVLDPEGNRTPIYFQDSQLIPHFLQHPYQIEAIQGRTLMKLFADLPAECLIFLTVKDDGSQQLTQHIQSELQSLGIQKLKKEHLRWSYVNVIRKTEEKLYVSLFEELSEQAIEIKLRRYEEFRGFVSPFDLHLYSGGYFCGNRAGICIDGNEYSLNERGMNIVVYEEQKDRITLCTVVDTFATIYESGTIYCANRKEEKAAL